MLHVFHSDRYVPTLPDGHRFPINKYQLIREQLLYEGTLAPEQLTETQPIDPRHILAVHTEEYWQTASTLTLAPRAVRKLGFPQSETLVDRSRRSLQGTLSALEAAMEHGIGMNIAGGTHHAYPGHGEGFCLLNDLAVSAQFALDHGWAQRVLIVDLDVHQGNGTAVVFQQDPRVFTFSMHGADNYPLRKERSDLDVDLPTGTSDLEYLGILKQHLPALISQHEPDVVLYQSGVDILQGDRLGKLAVSHRGCRERDEWVLGLCQDHEIPVAVSMGGGYGHRLVDTVEAHANTFRVAVDLFD
ncbi:histone deacetylase [Pontibacter sp. G13]|uniref:histone deacetylase family protein n=1 Tax=Pontibacter sp. G13 TaxID=3074898 RepID=UPI00288B19D7|nr:histone deacetylase [Pontibacter sp. G13]WNJ16775.1 histone deacetylase [Pontibacter sp. G13]